MVDVVVDPALWASSMLPEGILERWRVVDGAMVSAGDVIAEVRVEDALHEITAPASGRLSVAWPASAVIEPGCLLAQLA
jgi:pyruvate/2-oxoglutarate dehydrogenase complex dihydrolipoamide acyltransferase (E2) component